MKTTPLSHSETNPNDLPEADSTGDFGLLARLFHEATVNEQHRREQFQRQIGEDNKVQYAYD